MRKPKTRTERDISESKFEAVCEAYKLAMENGIPGYAIETDYGWIASPNLPTQRYGRVLECGIDGKARWA